jgi:hypothetical protein
MSDTNIISARSNDAARVIDHLLVDTTSKGDTKIVMECKNGESVLIAKDFGKVSS